MYGIDTFFLKRMINWLSKARRVRYVVSDNGLQFVEATSFASVLGAWRIRHVRIPIYAPSAGGFYETRHRAAVNCLVVSQFHKELLHPSEASLQEVLEEFPVTPEPERVK